MNSCTLGYLDRALVTAEEATALARQLEHPFSLGLAHEVIVHHYRGDPNAVRRTAKATLEIAEGHSFPYLSGIAVAWSGWAIGRSHPEKGIELIGEGIDRMATAGGIAWRHYLRALIGELHGDRGFYEEGLVLLEGSIGKGGLFSPDIQRIFGELLIAAGRKEEGRHQLENARGTAARREARLPELRASMSLVRLDLRERHSTGARAALAQVTSLRSWGSCV